jgi:hypothetical protein
VCVRFPWNTHYRVLHSFRLDWRMCCWIHMYSSIACAVQGK